MLVYPNPVTDHLTILFADENALPKKAMLRIMDALGHNVHTSTITEALSTIDMAHYTKGIYFLHITAENRNISPRKIVVQ